MEERAPQEGGSGATPLTGLPRWRLEDLYESPDSDSIGRDFAWIGEACLGFAKQFEGRLAGLTGDALAGALAEYETIQCRTSRLFLYAYLRFQQDTRDPAAAKFYGDAQSRLTDLSRPLVFFTLELNQIENAVLDAQCSGSPELARYRTWLDRQRALRDHQLPNQLEEYIHDISPVGAAAWNRLFEETISGLTFTVDGEALSLERVLNLLLSPDRSRRQAASEALADTFRAQVRLFARISNTLVKAKEINDRWRKLPTPQSHRHLDNDVEPAIVQALRDTVVEAYPRLSHRYYAMKARWLGLPQLEIWDRNAPLPESSDRIYGWDEARGIVLDAFRTFSPVFGAEAERFFDEGWIDAPAAEGKAPGAFSAPGPTDVHPYVFLNYLGRPRDVMTLAHELGHGVHQSLAAAQGELQAGTPLTFAETASVFGEMLVFRKLLDGETDRAARRTLLASKAEDMINTVVRQISFYEFESRIHAARREGELQTGDFGRIWMETAGESLGPAVHLREEYGNFWCYVPHFIHTPFYVYAYAFGDGLVNALYGLYRQEPEGFAEKYLDMLRAGGSLPHPEMLAPFGLDLHDPDFWKTGIDVIAGTIDEAEALEDT